MWIAQQAKRRSTRAFARFTIVNSVHCKFAIHFYVTLNGHKCINIASATDLIIQIQKQQRFCLIKHSVIWNQNYSGVCWRALQSHHKNASKYWRIQTKSNAEGFILKCSYYVFGWSIAFKTTFLFLFNGKSHIRLCLFVRIGILVYTSSNCDHQCKK